MAITKQQTPYELLVRWTNGTVAGAHIRFLERLVEVYQPNPKFPGCYIGYIY